MSDDVILTPNMAVSRHDKNIVSSPQKHERKMVMANFHIKVVNRIFRRIDGRGILFHFIRVERGLMYQVWR